VVRLLFDQNLSAGLVQRLADLFPHSMHVRHVGLDRASDAEVWAYAAAHGLVIVSKDADFHQLSFLAGAPPKAVWLRRGNCTTDDVEAMLREHHAHLTEFAAADDAAFLIID
jgi:predicted nuclease of predicted toxin-antitoxin system